MGTIESKFINNLIIKCKIANIFQNHIKSKSGDTFSWKSNLIHKGNLNSSGKIAIALQMQKFDYLFNSDQFKIYNYKKIFPIMSDLSINNYSINSLFKKYIFLIEYLKKILIQNLSLKNSLLNIEKFISNEFNEKNKIISFALSVLAQRLKSLKVKKLNSSLFLQYGSDFLERIDIFCLFLDLTSIYLGSANPISYKRVLNNKVLNDDLFFIINKFNR
jgi:hypothetical protein